MIAWVSFADTHVEDDSFFVLIAVKNRKESVLRSLIVV
jgi:hypothetical protein